MNGPQLNIFCKDTSHPDKGRIISRGKRGRQ